MGFPCSSGGKKSACKAGDLDSIPGSGRSLEKGNGNPLQCSCLENPMDRGVWQTIIHVVVRVDHDFHCLIWLLWMDNQQSRVITLSVS